ncbi:hypothetical protein LCGC14_2708530, partial [marine sediment metagenome]
MAIHAGAKPVFAEIDENSFNVTPETINEKINANTKAIIPVDIFGRPIDCKGFRELADDHNLFYLQDSCEALGSFQNGVHTGSQADAATFAFYPNKQMTTGEGGVIVSNDQDFIQNVKSLRNQGRAIDTSWLLHDKIGYNFRLTDIQAALGISQLSRIEQFIKAKQQIVEWYNEILGKHSDIRVPSSPSNERISWFVYTPKINFDNLKLDHRDQLVDLLRDKGIRAGRYFVPIHLQPIYRSMFGYE